MDYIEVNEKVRANLKESRYIHSLGVAEMAEYLAIRFNLDKEKAKICGIYHDIFRYSATFDSIPIVEEKGIVLDEDEKKNEGFLHGPLASALFDEELGEEVPSDMKKAVRYHTLGSVEMGKLGGVIFISDYIEKGRKHLTSEEREHILLSPTLEEMVLRVIEHQEKHYGEDGLMKVTRVLKNKLQNGIVL